MNRLYRPVVGVLALAFAWWVASGPGRAADDPKAFPKGSEKAVKAVQEALPKAVVDGADPSKEPSENPKAESPLYWNVRYHLGNDKEFLLVTPEGVIIRFPQVLEAKDLPEKVKDGLSKAVPDAKIRHILKQETRAAVRYVALEKPDVSYVADVVKGDKKVRVQATADGTILGTMPLKDDPKPGKGEAAPARPPEFRTALGADDKKKPAIPDEAAKAVKAVQQEFPGADVTSVENVGYDDGTGLLDVLNYSVTFTLKGGANQLNVTPDGVIVLLAVPIQVKDLPKAVADAVGKEVPDGTVRNAFKMETRAVLKFVPLDKPKALYKIVVESNKVVSAVRLREDGTVVKEPEKPGAKP